jgi:hypothetical protein
MAAKRQSAFNRALREAQNPAQPQTQQPLTSNTVNKEVTRDEPEQPLANIPGKKSGDKEKQEVEVRESKSENLAKQPVQHLAPPAEPRSTKDKGGRPRNVIPKKKFTYYLPDHSDEDIVAIKKALVRHADLLIDDKGDVVEQALGVMRYALEEEAVRKVFLEIYYKWKQPDIAD